MGHGPDLSILCVPEDFPQCFPFLAPCEHPVPLCFSALKGERCEFLSVAGLGRQGTFSVHTGWFVIRVWAAAGKVSSDCTLRIG